MHKLKLIMVGNGMAGARPLEALRRITPDMYDTTVFGAEPPPSYNRILLSPVLAGDSLPVDPVCVAAGIRPNVTLAETAHPLSRGIVHRATITSPLHSRKIQLEDRQVAAPDVGCVEPCPARIEGDNALLHI